MQIIILTSDKSTHLLNGFQYQWNRYFKPDYPVDLTVCGFSSPDNLTYPFHFVSVGSFEDYPQNKWTDYLLEVLDSVAEEVFFLTFDDFWLIRPTDIKAMHMLYGYMQQFEYVLKFDPTTERLFADGGGKYLFGYNTYDTLDYLDLIKSDHATAYHLSLWAGFWRKDLLKKFVIPGETAQQLEINGTGRLQQVGDEMLVLGTRQAPMRHGNVVQHGKWNQNEQVGLPALKSEDRKALKELGYLD